MSDENKRYYCQFCNNSFTSSSSKSLHERTNKKCISTRLDNSNIVEYKCKTCNKSFTQKVTLLNHELNCVSINQTQKIHEKANEKIEQNELTKLKTELTKLKTELLIKEEQIKFKDQQLKEKDEYCEKLLKEKEQHYEKLLKEKNTIIKEKEKFIQDNFKELISKHTSGPTVYQTNSINQTNNINYNNMKAEMINKLVPFTDENIINMISKINGHDLIYLNDFNAEKSFVSEFIKVVKTLALSVDASRGKLIIKNKTGETNTLLVHTFLQTIISKTEKQLLTIIHNARVFLNSEFENHEITLEDYSNCSYKLDIIKAHLKQNGRNKFLVFLESSLVKGLNVLQSKADYNKQNNLNSTNQSKILTTNLLDEDEDEEI